MTNWWGIVWILALIIVHEWGHYLVAKRQGIYKNIVIIPFGVAIAMTSYCKSRWDYLAGIATSCLVFPLFWLLEPALRDKIWYFFVFAVAIGVLDIITFIFYTPIVRGIEQKLARGETIPDFGVPINWIWEGRKKCQK